MIYKFFKVFKSEGIKGISKRLNSRYHRIKYLMLNQFGKNVVNSDYGVVMSKNWKDSTFRFCIEGAYGSFLSNHLKKKKNYF